MTETQRKYADGPYKNKKVIEFNVQLTTNHYTNFQNVHLCFPTKFKLAADSDNDITAGIIIVNTFFSHWIREIDVKRYGDDMPILPLTNTVNINRYSNELLKQLPEKELKTMENGLLYSKKKLYLLMMLIDAIIIQEMVQMQIIELMKTLWTEHKNFKIN